MKEPDPQIRAGQHWVDERVRKLVQKGRTSVRSFEWETADRGSAQDFMDGLDEPVWLVLRVSKERRLIRFLVGELAAVQGDTAVQAMVV